jgi:hypothetical protein
MIIIMLFLMVTWNVIIVHSANILSISVGLTPVKCGHSLSPVRARVNIQMDYSNWHATSNNYEYSVKLQ